MTPPTASAWAEFPALAAWLARHADGWGYAQDECGGPYRVWVTIQGYRFTDREGLEFEQVLPALNELAAELARTLR